MSTPAQDEFDLFYASNQLDRFAEDPEDRSNPSSSSSSLSDKDSTTLHSDRPGTGDETLVSNASSTMPMATTYIPTATQFDANTGPKGVIADARSFETARKRSFRRTLYAFSNAITGGGLENEKKTMREKSKSPSPDLSADDEEDDFMRTWRANRLEQLANQKQEIRTRRQSPSQRRYGSLVTVDPLGYLDAVEKVPACTIVVVLIYDDESSISGKVEDALKVIARNHATVRFVKLHFLDAEMDEIAAPGILAYRNGDCFANLVSVVDEIPSGQDINTTSLEKLLQQHQILI